MTTEVRAGEPADASDLTEVAFAAKRYWNYPEEYLHLWEDTLTVTPSYVEGTDVYCAERNGGVVGFCAIEGEGEDESGTRELAHLWVRPEEMGRGIGGSLLEHAIAGARSTGTRRIEIASDPHAVGFYRRYGAREIGRVPSTPDGRTLPLLAIEIE